MKKPIIIPKTKLTGKELIQKGKKIRVCAYARVSTEFDDQINSFKSQVQRYTRIICEEHKKDWTFVKVYTDEGKSGTNINHRQGFLEMLHDCQEGKIDLILVKQISRFGRNVAECISVINTLRQQNVEVYFEEDNLYASDTKLDLMLSIFFATAQEESRQISVRVTAGIKEKNAKW